MIKNFTEKNNLKKQFHFCKIVIVLVSYSVFIVPSFILTFDSTELNFLKMSNMGTALLIFQITLFFIL